MLKSVEPTKRIEWDVYPVTSESLTLTRIPVSSVSASDEVLQHVLSGKRYRMQQYSESGVMKIGYGIGDATSVLGMTEGEAFSQWIAYAKDKQRMLKNQLPVTEISQTQFDAVFSLFMTTGTFKTSTSINGEKYDVMSAIKSEDWNMVADMISNSQDTAGLSSGRLFEARVLKLGDYTGVKTRDWLRNEGIQYTRKTYLSDRLSEIQRRQAEMSYYRQLGLFLPNISETRKRAIFELTS